MKPRIDPGLRDLLGLSLLAAGGCGLALSQGDLLFVAIFGGACAVIAIEALRPTGAATQTYALILKLRSITAPATFTTLLASNAVVTWRHPRSSAPTSWQNTNMR